MSEELEVSQKGIHWDAPHYYLDGHVFIPRVHEREELNNQSNSIAIQLDGTTSSHLEWNQAKTNAREFIKKGYKIFWNLDLGLFSRLKRPLSNQTQYLSLELSLKHFKEFIWNDLCADSLGVCLYQGPAEFRLDLQLDEEDEGHYEEWTASHPPIKSEWQRSLFCQDVGLEFLELLTSSMPDEIPLFLMLDVKQIQDFQLELFLLHPERYGRLNLILKNSHLPHRCLGWGESSIYGIVGEAGELLPKEKPQLGICLPTLDKMCKESCEGLSEILNLLIRKKKSFRLIPESFLISEWDGLSDLIVLKEFLQPQGIRKLRGFNAAGGKIIFWKEPTHLEPEVSFFEWNKELF